MEGSPLLTNSALHNLQPGTGHNTEHTNLMSTSNNIFVITSGSFTEGGNFSGYNQEAKRIHVAGRVMNNLGWTKASEVKYPFVVIAEEKTFNQLSLEKDEQGNRKPIFKADGVTPETFSRLTALSAFANKEALADAQCEVATIEGYLEQRLAQAKASVSLNSASVASLANISA